MKPEDANRDELLRHGERIKRMHDARRAAGVCINNATHGAAVRGGRCADCWRKKLDGDARYYRNHYTPRTTT